MNYDVVCRSSVMALGATCLSAYIYKTLRRDTGGRGKKIVLPKNKMKFQLGAITITDVGVNVDLLEEKKEQFSIIIAKFDFTRADMVHVTLDDSNGCRYAIENVILETEEIFDPDELHVSSIPDQIAIEYKPFTIIITAQPDLTINIYNNQTLVMVFNHEQRLKLNYAESVNIIADFFFPGGQNFHGLPQRMEHLILRKSEQRFYQLFKCNSPDPESERWQGLNGTVPILYSCGLDATAGLLWLNATETSVRLSNKVGGTAADYYSEGGSMEFYILSGRTLAGCVMQNARLTGVAPLPPIHALGYHQSKNSYTSQEEVRKLNKSMNRLEIPLDSFWMDIQCTDDKKFFTWHPEMYDDPHEIMEYLSLHNRYAFVATDPIIKVDHRYRIFKQCLNNGYFIKNASNTAAYEDSGPMGTCAWIDLLNPAAREYYASLYEDFLFTDNISIWNSQTSRPSINCFHYGDVLHRDVHNIYGFYNSMTTYAGMLRRSDLRPFILTNDHFSGSQRYAAISTGDCMSSWDHLKASVSLCLSQSLAGLSLCGADVGGSFGTPTEELLQRWYQLGSWLPFFRAHNDENSRSREPFLLKGSELYNVRTSICNRYKHLLYWYTMFYFHNKNGEPVIRPIFYQYPLEKAVNVDTEFLVGKDILVAPVLRKGATKRKVYLPGRKDIWFLVLKNLSIMYRGQSTFSLHVDILSTPVFYRAGSIIPLVEKHTPTGGTVIKSDFCLHIFCDTDNMAHGHLYLDDGVSFQFQRNLYKMINFSFANTVLNVEPLEGEFIPTSRLVGIRLYGLRHNIVETTINDKKRLLKKDDVCYKLDKLDINIGQPLEIVFE